MKNKKQKTLALVTATTLCAGAFALSGLTAEKTSAKADTPQSDFVVAEAVANDDGGIEPRGIYTKIQVGLDGGNGEVWVVAKNSFTLLPSYVKVVLELYSSDTYQESYTNMTLVSNNYTEDLNMGKSIEARASTGGVQKYWKARVRFRADSRDWEEIITETRLFDANGIYIG